MSRRTFRTWLTCGLVSATLVIAVDGGATPQRQSLLLENARLVDVDSGTVSEGATVLVTDGTIETIATGPEAGARLRQRADGLTELRRIDLRGRYLLPGLIDAHVHIGDLGAARRALRSGVTTARSMGAAHFIDVGMRELRRFTVVEAPALLAAGYHVRPQPAEGFFLDFPELAVLRDTGIRGPEAIRRMARALVSRGVDFIKVNATERAGLPETDPRAPFYDEEELRALVQAAGATDVPVAAHAHGDAGARAAVRAGVRSIEHGTYLSETTLRLMAERGTYLVPTIAVVADLSLPGGDYDSALLQIRGRHMLPQIRRTATLANLLGVPIVAATDTGYGPASVVRLAHELMELVGIGMTPHEALQSATTVAARLLRVDGTTGRLREGLDADLLAVDANPLVDIGALQDPLLVVSDGRVVVDRLGY